VVVLKHELSMNVWQSAADAAARILLAIPAGYEGDVFRPGQREVIDAVCHEGKNVLAVLPTGSGKL
jgi:superfamily II DNA helicase RecQ